MSSKNGVYVIGCKIPTGLVIRGAGKEYKLNGANSSVLVNGFGLTEGVPADIWEDFAKNHAKSKAIVNGIVFAVGDVASAKDVSEENKGVKTKMEQLDPNKQAVKPDVEA